jgi:hypothetical protein
MPDFQDLWNGLAQQPWWLRGVIGAVFGALVLVVVPPLIGKKEVAAAKGGDGGSAQVGGKGTAIGGAGGEVAGRTLAAKVVLVEQLAWVAVVPRLEALADR